MPTLYKFEGKCIIAMRQIVALTVLEEHSISVPKNDLILLAHLT